MRFFPEIRVHPDVGLHPAFLFELHHPVHAFQFHALLQIKLQVSVVHDVVVFVLQCQQQLFAVRGVQIQVFYKSFISLL